MDRAYWDGLADRFDDEVLKILDRDRDGRLAAVLDRLASPRKTVADLGCGNGSLLPLLAPRFRDVHAVDLSGRLLAAAQSRFAALNNVRYVEADLAAPLRLDRRVDVVVCVNVLIHPDPAVRSGILDNAVTALKRRGCLVLVVPAYESLLHTYRTIVEVNVDLGVDRSQAVSEVEAVYAEEVVSAVDGIVRFGTEPTKLHTAEEVHAILSDHGLVRAHAERIEFDWSEMIDDAPAGLGAPYPWDWLFTARKP